MKKLAFLWLCLAFALPTNAANDKIRQAIEKGLVTRDFLNTLTQDDVPEKWRAQKTTREMDKGVAEVYTRDSVKLLEVIWAREWTGDKEKMFVATVYHGDKRLTKIVRMGDSTSIMPSEAPKGYTVITSIKDDGAVTVTVMNDDNSFLEVIVVKGRETHLLDDLEYTKAALSMEGIVKPIMGVLQDAIGKKPRKKGKQK
jgi:hypothetical protein